MDCFLELSGVGFVISNMVKGNDGRAIDLDGMNFVTTRVFNQSAIGLTVILIVIYVYFW